MYSDFNISVQNILICLLLLGLINHYWRYIRRFYYVSRLPGPPALPLIGNLLLFCKSMEELTKFFMNDLRKYGSRIRLWFVHVPVVIVYKPNDVNIVLNHPNSMEKATIQVNVMKPIFGDSILLSPVEKWKRNRRIVQSCFRKTIIDSFLPIFVRHSNILVRELEKERGKTFDVLQSLTRLTFDVVCEGSLGVHINSQCAPSEFFNLYHGGMKIICNRGLTPWLHPDIIFKMTSASTLYENLRKETWKMTDNVIAEKRSSKEKQNIIENNYQTAPEDNDINEKARKPLLDYLIDLAKADPQFTDTDVRNEVNMVTVAAIETSAVTLSYILVSLGEFQDVQNKLYEEIIQVFNYSDRDIQLSDFPKLEYMEAVIKETLRLYPTIPFIIRETTGDVQLDNYTIPAETMVIVAPYYTHTDEEIWPKHDQFIPERMLYENAKDRHAFSWIPFSAGPRNCVGIKYAMMFMKVSLVIMLRKYKIHTELKRENFEFCTEISLKLLGGHLIALEPRK